MKERLLWVFGGANIYVCRISPGLVVQDGMTRPVSWVWQLNAWDGTMPLFYNMCSYQRRGWETCETMTALCSDNVRLSKDVANILAQCTADLIISFFYQMQGHDSHAGNRKSFSSITSSQANNSTNLPIFDPGRCREYSQHQTDKK